MIDASEARLLAQQAIANEHADEAWQLGKQVTELLHHWVFSYNTVEYFTSGNPLSGLAGNGPIAVSKDDGHVSWLRGGQPLEDQLY
jgi:hypothetical protein